MTILRSGTLRVLDSPVRTPFYVQENDLKKRLRRALEEAGPDFSHAEKLEALRSVVAELEARGRGEGAGPLRIVPFRPGVRPLDEAVCAGTGASDFGGVIDSGLASGSIHEEVLLLFELDFTHPDLVDVSSERIEVGLELSLLGVGAADGKSFGLARLAVPAAHFDPNAFPELKLVSCPYASGMSERWVAAFDSVRDLMPREAGGIRYEWAQAPDWLRHAVSDEIDPFGLTHGYHQRVRADLVLSIDGREAFRDATVLEVFDLGRLGSLYQRLIDRLLPRDVARQKRALGSGTLDLSHHPWFPVLVIGSDKASLYARAIRDDFTLRRRNLAEPAWLLRVGLYLELLTCLGIAAAVEDEVPELLSDEERAYIEQAEAFAPIRERLNVQGWKRVWALREIAPARREFGRTGPVDLWNLRRKQEATLAFLHEHHEDLKRAIELAGPNRFNAQETWHRVFRDAERAVLRNAESVFPELFELSARYREFALWHQVDKAGLLGSALPGFMSDMLGQLDGVYPSGSRKYRESMNDVARWGRARGLMDYTGDVCIPERASLIEAKLAGDHARYAALQRHDNHDHDERTHARSSGPGRVVDLDDLLDQLRTVGALRSLTEPERMEVARGTRLVSFDPDDRVVVRGEPGDSLFVIVEGEADVVVRRDDGHDVAVERLGPGSVFGEAALLTGEPRTATIRAATHLHLYEVSKACLAPIIRRRPSLTLDLSVLFAERLAARPLRLVGDPLDQERTRDGFAKRIRDFLLS